MTRDAARRRLRLLRVRAVLAGGLVLGVGAAATLASWNDAEYAATTVSSGRFGVVGAVNAGAFAEHPTSPGATLTFSPALAGVYPGSPAGYITVQIRTVSTAGGGAFDSVPGTLQMTTATSPTDALAQALVYAVRVIPSGSSCGSALFSNASAPVIVPNDTPLSTAVTASAANVQTLQAAGANVVGYCITIALPAGAPDGIQGVSTTVVWQFAGSTP